MRKMINKIKFKSLMSKSITIILICSILFMLIALPIVENATYNLLHPYLLEYTTMKISDGSARMSKFLGLSNPAMYRRSSRNEDFCAYAIDYIDGKSNKEEFARLIADSIKPVETELTLADNSDYDCISYPAFYIEEKGIFCDDEMTDKVQYLLDNDWFKNYKENYITKYLYAPVLSESGDPMEDGYFYYVYSFYADPDSTIPVYAILMTKFTDILPLWSGFLELGASDYAFIGNDSEEIFQNDSREIDLAWVSDNLISDRQHNVVRYEHETDDEISFCVLVSNQKEGLRFAANVPNDIFQNLFRSTSFVTQGMIVVVMAILIFIVLFILKHIFKRLTVLAEKMAVVQDGNYNVTIDDTNDDEIGRLGTAFNIMTGKIQEYLDKSIEKEQREKMLQYNLTLSSIDPHFLYNTLNTVTRLAELGRNNEVVEVNDALINCLKDNLMFKNYKAYDTVENECSLMGQYLKIQNYLCDNTLDLTVHTSDEAKKLLIPKFLLQPLVENAINHGILMNFDELGNMQAGKIDITVENDSEHITIKIKDNGIGMTEETIKEYFSIEKAKLLTDQNSNKEHIGILITMNRLAYLYDNNFTLDVTSELGKGTEIVITIPLN